MGEVTDDDLGMARKVIMNVTAPYEQVVQHRIWEKPIAESLAQAREEGRKEVLESKKLESLLEYLRHDELCIRNRFEAGEPTPNGGYRSQYAGKWYQVSPIDKTPKCNCGFVEAFDALKSREAGK